MQIKITEWKLGTWETVDTPVVRVTKTMIVVRWGRGEQKFNRQHGNVAGHSTHGMSGMTDPRIFHEELQRFEAELKAKGLSDLQS
jgi:hypothetical protein